MRRMWITTAIALVLLVPLLILERVQPIRMPPRTYREAVMQVLDERQIAYSDVAISDYCPPSPQCIGTGTVYMPLTAVVTVSGVHPAYGRMECLSAAQHEAFWAHCMLSLPQLHMYDVVLPTLEKDRPWFALLQHFWNSGHAWWKSHVGFNSRRTIASSLSSTTHVPSQVQALLY